MLHEPTLYCHRLPVVGPSQAQRIVPVPRPRHHPAVDLHCLYVTVLLPPSTEEARMVHLVQSSASRQTYLAPRTIHLVDCSQGNMVLFEN